MIDNMVHCRSTTWTAASYGWTGFLGVDQGVVQVLVLLPPPPCFVVSLQLVLIYETVRAGPRPGWLETRAWGLEEGRHRRPGLVEVGRPHALEVAAAWHQKTKPSFA